VQRNGETIRSDPDTEAPFPVLGPSTRIRHPATGLGAPRSMTDNGGGFNGSVQHLLIWLDEEVVHGDITDTVHGAAVG